MNSFFIDSNVCVYAFDKTDDLKRQKAFELIRQYPHTSSQVIIETYNACYRKLKLSSDICDENTLYLCDITQVVEINSWVIRKAISLKKKYVLSFLDACIVAAALEANCSILFSEDMHHGLVIEESLTIINPFIAESPGNFSIKT